jgi:exopolysaccharide production protein ExoZ
MQRCETAEPAAQWNRLFQIWISKRGTYSLDTSIMKNQIESLQGLRAFAAIAVVLVHAKFLLPGGVSVGAFGVHLFFVISGFIMAHICVTNPAQFLRRRIARIVPPYWAMTIMVFLLAWLAPAYLHTTTPDLVNLLKSLLFVPYEKEHGVIQPMLFLGWSLNWEMIFYVFVSGALYVTRRYASLLGAFSVAIFCLLCMLIKRPGDVLLAFYSLPVGFEFLLGAMAYELFSRVDTTTVSRWRGALLFCAFGSLVALFLVEWLLQGTLMFALLAALSFIAVCSATLLSAAGYDLKNKQLIAIGDSSYIIYLIHPFCVSLFEKTVSNRLKFLTPDHVAGLILCICLVVAVSWAIHVYVELPSYRKIRRLVERKINEPSTRGAEA